MQSAGKYLFFCPPPQFLFWEDFEQSNKCKNEMRDQSPWRDICEKWTTIALDLDEVSRVHRLHRAVDISKQAEYNVELYSFLHLFI